MGGAIGQRGAAARARKRVGDVPWSPAVGVSGWLLSIASAILVVPAVAAALMAAGLTSEDATAWLLPLTPVVTGVVALLVASSVSGGSPRDLWVTGWPKGRALLIAAALGVAAFGIFNVGLGAAVVYALELLGMEPPEVQQGLRDAAGSSDALPILILSTTVAAPLGEELLYRGLLYQSLLRRLRPAAAAWLSALAFGVGHAAIGVAWLSNLVLVLLIVPLGVLLAWSFRRYGTLWVPIVIHCVFNGITVALMASGMV